MHLVALWNPSYAVDALDAHAQLLLKHVRAAEAKKAAWSEAYVWWGRVRSQNRQQPLEHLSTILALNNGISERGELQLYLTDFRSLFVAEVFAIASGDKVVEDPDHVPRYYATDRLSCDCWFKLGDLRMLVDDDTLAVQAELKQLRVTTYNDRPVSLYGGMVNLPLLVTRPDGECFFDEDERDLLNDGALWVVADEARFGLGGLMADLRDNLFGVAVWKALPPTARTFVATAERLMRDHRRDTSFDFATVLVELCKAVEVQVKAVLSEVLRDAPPGVRHMSIDGKIFDLAAPRAFSAGQLAYAIAHDVERMRYLERELTESTWFTRSLPPILEELAEARNPAAHSERRSRSEVLRLRDAILGVGCEGHLVKLSRVRVRRTH